jgi:hypothetical protein
MRVAKGGASAPPAFIYEYYHFGIFYQPNPKMIVFDVDNL